MSQKDHVSGEMSFLEHLEELRWAILKSVVAITIGMIGCFFFSEYILKFLIMPTHAYAGRLELQFLKPAGMFMVRIMTSLACGFALAMPYTLYQFWSFISPGLLEQEKKYVPHVIFFSTFLFLMGASFAFFVLMPVLVNFFIVMGIEGVKAQWDIGEYMGLVTKMVLLNGAVFEMPIIIGFLTWIRLVSPELLKRSWRYAMVIIFILAAVITPTGDPFTQIIVAVPLILLFFLSIGVSSFVARWRRQDVEEETEEAPDEEPTGLAGPDAPTTPRSPQTGPEAPDYFPDPYEDEYIYENPDFYRPYNRIEPEGLAERRRDRNTADDETDQEENPAQTAESDQSDQNTGAKDGQKPDSESAPDAPSPDHQDTRGKNQE